MAKNTPHAGQQRSKVRLFFVDADLAPGDLQELTNALTTAIRPTHVLHQRPNEPQRIAATPAVSDPELQDADAAEVVEDGFAGEVTSNTNGKPRVRRPRSVQVLHDIDWMGGGGKSWGDFVKDTKPSTDLDRFIVAAFWLDAYAKIPAVGPDHIYSCYQATGWTWDHKDATAPLRKLKKLGCGKLQRGTFSIEVLGRTRVQKLIEKNKSTTDS